MTPQRMLAAAGLLLASAPALAHTGLHVGGFASGASHPFMGLDHLLAMVLVGFWAAQQQGPWQRLAPPLAFVGAMALGGYLGQAGFALLQVETGIALSVLALGLLTAFAVRLPSVASLLVIGGFALFHGHAHGAEMPAVALWTYMPGFILATALLHGLGYFSASSLVDSRSVWVRGAGLVSALAGGGMLVG
ncbi:MAG: HupE/UreJ family protein [Pseudomonadota bacterium]